MKLREFLSLYKIKVPEFAKACEIKPHTMRTYVYETRTPPLESLYRIILQSGYQVTLEDFREPNIAWKVTKKLKTTATTSVGGLDVTKMKKHERKKYFTDLDSI